MVLVFYSSHMIVDPYNFKYNHNLIPDGKVLIYKLMAFILSIVDMHVPYHAMAFKYIKINGD